MQDGKQQMDEIRQIVAEVLELDPVEIMETSLFKEDHQADSLRAIEILARLEKKYKIEIPQSELANMTHLAAVYDVVKVRGGWANSDA